MEKMISCRIFNCAAMLTVNAFILLAGVSAATANQNKPNIIIILADDMVKFSTNFVLIWFVSYQLKFQNFIQGIQ